MDRDCYRDAGREWLLFCRCALATLALVLPPLAVLVVRVLLVDGTHFTTSGKPLWIGLLFFLYVYGFAA